MKLHRTTRACEEVAPAVVAKVQVTNLTSGLTEEKHV
uniref:Uncharacterized protein n=1 Tax=Anguilla anguilla TaxID=7936 RepID=A0A0E9TF67_ANGAN